MWSAVGKNFIFGLKAFLPLHSVIEIYLLFLINITENNQNVCPQKPIPVQLIVKMLSFSTIWSFGNYVFIRGYNTKFVSHCDGNFSCAKRGTFRIRILPDPLNPFFFFLVPIWKF